MMIGGGRNVGESSDVYSYAIVLWEMLCGEHAWAGEHATDVCRRGDKGID